MFWNYILAVLVASLSGCIASRLNPPVLPLTVRGPYLSTWLQDARASPWNRWPMFWTGEEIGFSVIAAVPETGKVYPLLGKPHDSLLPAEKDDDYEVSFPVYLGAEYDASSTNLTYLIPAPEALADKKDLQIVLSFLSPVTPTSTLRQAIPASYIHVEARGHFDVDIYIDVNGQWVSGDRGSVVKWDLKQKMFEDGKGLKTFRVQRQTEQLFTEFSDRAEWGTLHFTGPADAKHEVGTSYLVRRRFSNTRTLQNAMDMKFRSIMDDEPIFAFSKSFSLNSSLSSGSATFTIAHIQDPVVQYAASKGLTNMKPLWASYFESAEAALIFHYFDFPTASKLATDYSSRLAKDAYESSAEDYVDIVALSARQVMGAVSFSGTQDNPLLFLKEISSNGNMQTIDVIFPAFPFFLYTNPRWLAYLLEPLIEHMLSGQYPNTYAMHDIGTHFPNATGHPDGNDEYMPVEECGNILIMGLALVNSMEGWDDASGLPWALNGLDKDEFTDSEVLLSLARLDTVQGVSHIDPPWRKSKGSSGLAKLWVQKSYRLWKQWTGYLVEFSLEPANQLSTDDFAGWLHLQTNLALKGIIGIKAMSGIAAIADKKEDAKKYEEIAQKYIKKWEEFAISRDKTHAKLAYDWYGSWTTLYNLYADSLLCFNVESSAIDGKRLSRSDASQRVIGDAYSKEPSVTSGGFVPNHVYKIQSEWYHNVMQDYGLPLDNRHLYTKSDWEFFAAAVASKATRKEILDHVAKWVNETATDRPLTDLYDTEGEGGFPGVNFFARPVIGGHFAFLTLERACDGEAVKALNFLNDAD